MPKREMNWFDVEDNSIGFFPLETTADGDFLCPQCGLVCNYWEGAIGQDRQGNDILGWTYDCWHCGITTDAHEL